MSMAINKRRVGAHLLAFLCVGMFVILLFAMDALAQPTSGNNPPTSGNSMNELKNPLQIGTIEGFLVAIIQILVVFATPIIVLFIMYAGYLFVTARGDTGKLEDAKRALLWSVVGGVIVLGAELIAQIIKGTVTGLQL